MKKKAVLFGTGSFAEVIDFYLTNDSCYDVVGFCVSADRLGNKEFLDRPVVPFETVEQVYPPDAYEMFIAVGYAKLNSLREGFARQAKEKGYSLLSYVCSKATTWNDLKVGDNCFVFEDNTIQPFVTIGENTVLWSGNHIGHHSEIGANCFIASHVVVSGHCRIGDYSFVGVNATITDSVSVGARNIIGPGSLIQKNTTDGQVYLAERAKIFPKDSGRFFK